MLALFCLVFHIYPLDEPCEIVSLCAPTEF